MYWHNLSYANTQFFAMLLMIRAFSTQHPAMAFIPGVRLICRWLLFTSFCPSAVQPLEIHGRSDVQNHQRVRTRLPAANDTPLANSSYYSPGLPGVWSVFSVVEIVLCYNNAARQKPQRIDLYRAADGRDRLHGALSTRREISSAIGKHSMPPPNIRRRPMHSIEGAFV